MERGKEGDSHIGKETHMATEQIKNIIEIDRQEKKRKGQRG